MNGIQELFDLTGRVAIVTGGAGFLGQQFIEALSEAGAHIVVADINQNAADEFAEVINQKQGSAVGIGVDVTKPSSVQDLMDQTLQKFKRLDILVNSAALDPKFDDQHQSQHVTSFEDFPLGAWKDALDVNLTGMFLACQSAARIMNKTGKGSLINICSTYGIIGPDQRLYESLGEPRLYKPVYYSVSKAGVLGLTKYIATYYEGTEIRCNTLTPGGVERDHDPAFKEAYGSRTVLGRMAYPHEMKGAIVFLASEASSYMTGTNLVVDGGWTAW
ncbi:MAG: SDR family oxidoreductase [Anaerolineales bacterium]|nr:SDR family oxidoreductase [Anaerolineales bacterium]